MYVRALGPIMVGVRVGRVYMERERVGQCIIISRVYQGTLKCVYFS